MALTFGVGRERQILAIDHRAVYFQEKLSSLEK
jgi:hypothetical protein